MKASALNIVAGEPEIVSVNTSTAHFAEAATFGGRPHNYPAWLCGLLHKRYFFSCRSGDKKWGSHVSCGYCQKCRHFDYRKLRFFWLPSEAKPHKFHIIVDGSRTHIVTNELYLQEIFNLISMLACAERDNEPHAGTCELSIEMASTSSFASYHYLSHTLDKQARLRVLSHLFILYEYAMEGSAELPAEQRWWHKK